MELSDFVDHIPGFDKKTHAEKIKIFAWYLHTHARQDYFSGGDIRKCFSALRIDGPVKVSSFLDAMVQRRPKQALKTRDGFCLERRLRDKYDEELGQRPATVFVHKLLTELPAKIPDLAERSYLAEAITCFKYKAFRASIVMAWNLGYDHLCQLVVKKHLAKFNTQLAASFPRKAVVIAKRDDLTALLESEVLQICKSGNIINGNLHRVMKEKLDRRNIAAHPSGVEIFESTAEEFIKDLIENVVLKLA